MERITLCLLLCTLLLSQCDTTSSNTESSTEEELTYTLIEKPLDSTNESDYLIITPPSLLKTAKELANYRNVNINDDVEDASILTLSELNFNSVENIRTLIKYSLNNWNKKPEYIVLLGNNSLDDNTVSIPFVEDSLQFSFGDNYYIKKRDYTFYDVAIGRIPISNNNDGAKYLDKLKSFENKNDKSILTIADDGWMYLGADGIEHNKNALYTLDSVSSNYSKDTFLLEMFCTCDSSAPLSEDEIKNAKSSFFKKLNNNNGIICYYGHNNTSKWTDEIIFDGTKIDDINKINSTSIYSLGGCIYKDTESSIPLQLLRKEKSGAVAFIGTAGVAYSGVSFLFLSNLWKTYSNSDDISLGKAIKDTQKATNIHTFICLGDPALRS